MATSSPALGKALSVTNIAVLVLTGASLFGLEEAHKLGLTKIKMMPLFGELTSSGEEDVAINLDQIALLVTRAQEEVSSRVGPESRASIEDAFSPREAVAIATPPPEEYILPPVTTPSLPETPPEDLRKVFIAAFPLDGVTSNGAFFNNRFTKSGEVIFQGTAPGKEATVVAKLQSVDKTGAWVEVNGERVRMEVQYNTSL